MLLSSGLCSRELDPWDKVRDPEDDDKSLFCAMDPTEPPSQIAVSCVLLREEPGLSLCRTFFWSSSLGSEPGGRLFLNLFLFFLFIDVAITRNLTGPLCAWYDTIPLPGAKRKKQLKNISYFTTVFHHNSFMKSAQKRITLKTLLYASSLSFALCVHSLQKKCTKKKNLLYHKCFRTVLLNQLKHGIMDFSWLNFCALFSQQHEHRNAANFFLLALTQM